MDQPVVTQPAKKGRPRKPEMQPTRLPPETHADALRLSLPDVPPLPEFAAPR